MIRVTSRWWSQSSFVLTDLVSAVVNTWVFLVLPSSRMVITEGELLYFVISFNTELQVTTFRFTSGVHSLSLLRWCTRCCFHRVVKYSGFFVVRTVNLHRRAGSCWRVPFEQQMIHRYTDMHAPIICDFANVYHDPMTISFSWTIVCCPLCLRT